MTVDTLADVILKLSKSCLDLARCVGVLEDRVIALEKLAGLEGRKMDALDLREGAT